MSNGTRFNQVVLVEFLDGETMADQAEIPIDDVVEVFHEIHEQTYLGIGDRRRFIDELVDEEMANLAAALPELGPCLVELGIPAEPFAPVVEWVNSDAMQSEIYAPFALIHFDGHFKNILLLREPRAERKVAVVDWELARPGDPVIDFVRMFHLTGKGPATERLRQQTTAPPNVWDLYYLFLEVQRIVHDLIRSRRAVRRGRLTLEQIQFIRTELRDAFATARSAWGQNRQLSGSRILAALGVMSPPPAQWTGLDDRAGAAVETPPPAVAPARPWRNEVELPDPAAMTHGELEEWVSSLPLDAIRTLMGEVRVEVAERPRALYRGETPEAGELSDAARVLNALIFELGARLPKQLTHLGELRPELRLLNNEALSEMVFAFAAWRPLAEEMLLGADLVVDAIGALRNPAFDLRPPMIGFALPFREICRHMDRVARSAQEAGAPLSVGRFASSRPSCPKVAVSESCSRNCGIRRRSMIP